MNKIRYAILVGLCYDPPKEVRPAVGSVGALVEFGQILPI